MRDPDPDPALDEFLNDVPGASSLLADLRTSALRYFPAADLQTVLEVDHDDPEASGFTHVSLVVTVHGADPEAAFQTLERFREEWWMDRAIPQLDIFLQVA